MITAEFEEAGGRIAAFSVRGHSGYATQGADIVCASVSSAVWMTINGLESVMGLSPVYTQTDALVTCRLASPEIVDAQVLLQSLKQFLCNLSTDYGDYLTVKEVHRNV